MSEIKNVKPDYKVKGVKPGHKVKKGKIRP